MKKYLLLLIAIILMVMPLAACTFTDDTETTPYATKTQIDNLQKVYDVLKGEVDKKASKADLETKASLSYVNEKTSGLTAPNLTNYYTKAEVDTAIANAINAYKASLTTTTGGTTVPTVGGVTINVYSMSPQTIYGEGDYTIFLEVKNTNPVVKKIYISGYLTAQTATCNIDTTNTKFTKDGVYLVNNPTASFSPTTGDLCQSIICTTDPFFVGGNQTVMLPLKLTLDFKSTPGTPSMWTASWNPMILQ